MTDALDLLTQPQETEPENPAPEIPEGWVLDKETKQYRPPKRRGRRPAATPPPTDHEPITRADDTEPDSKARGKTRAAVPRWKAGVISKGMAKLYRRTGKILKAIDRDIGIAVIESADDCGEAWDDLARTNPRIRAALLKMITGGSWASLLWAHAPIFMAIAMKDGIRKHIPFMRFVETMFEPDENGTSEMSEALGGLQPGDVNQMMGFAQGLMRSMHTWDGVPVAENAE